MGGALAASEGKFAGLDSATDRDTQSNKQTKGSALIDCRPVSQFWPRTGEARQFANQDSIHKPAGLARFIQALHEGAGARPGDA